MKIFRTILTIIFQQFTAFLLKFDSPQVKQGFISNIINFVYELLHKLLNNLRLRNLENYGIVQKS